MKYQTIASIAAGAMLFGCTSHQSPSPGDLTRWVNPFIGTDFTGNTYPGAQAPFGMVQLSPDNGLPGWDRIAGYFYPDSTIAGFSHTHLSGTGAGDLYDISFMPVTIPYVVGDVVRLSFDIESREYMGRWYTSVRGWKAEKVTPGGVADAPVQPFAAGAAVPPPPAVAPADASDDLPF